MRAYNQSSQSFHRFAGIKFNRAMRLVLVATCTLLVGLPSFAKTP